MKLDRRVRRTRRQLAQSIIELVEQMPYEEITIHKITEHADMNRATFYLHYGSKEELLVAALESRFDELVETFEGIVSERPLWEDNTVDVMTFQHVADHASLYKALLSEKGLAYVIYKIINYIADYGEAECKKFIPDEVELKYPFEIISQFHAGAMFALIAWWLRNDMPHSAEYMGKAVHELATPGTIQTIMQSTLRQPPTGSD